MHTYTPDPCSVVTPHVPFPQTVEPLLLQASLSLGLIAEATLCASVLWTVALPPERVYTSDMEATAHTLDPIVNVTLHTPVPDPASVAAPRVPAL